jgi:hypothetical protein
LKRSRVAFIILVPIALISFLPLYLVPMSSETVSSGLLSGGYLLVDHSHWQSGLNSQPAAGSLAANISTDSRFMSETHGQNYTFISSFSEGGGGTSEEVLVFYHYGNQLEQWCDGSLRLALSDVIYVHLTSQTIPYINSLNGTNVSLGTLNFSVTHESTNIVFNGCPAFRMEYYPANASLLFLWTGHGAVYAPDLGYILVL